MKEKETSKWYYLVFLIYPLLSLVYYIKYIKSFERALSFMLYVAVSFIVTVLLWKSISAVNSRFDLKKISVISVTAVVLAAVDQLIKLVLSKTGFETKLISNIFMIKQTHNVNQTGLFNFLKIETSQTSMLIFKAVLLVLVICLYRLFKSDTAKKAYVFAAAAVTSHLLDTVFYGYTLDYIFFRKTIVYDMKNYYVDVFVAALIIIVIGHELKKSKEKKKVI